MNAQFGSKLDGGCRGGIHKVANEDDVPVAVGNENLGDVHRIEIGRKRHILQRDGQLAALFSIVVAVVVFVVVVVAIAVVAADDELAEVNGGAV